MLIAACLQAGPPPQEPPPVGRWSLCPAHWPAQPQGPVPLCISPSLPCRINAGRSHTGSVGLSSHVGASPWQGWGLCAILQKLLRGPPCGGSSDKLPAPRPSRGQESRCLVPITCPGGGIPTSKVLTPSPEPSCCGQPGAPLSRDRAGPLGHLLGPLRDSNYGHKVGEWCRPVSCLNESQAPSGLEGSSHRGTGGSEQGLSQILRDMDRLQTLPAPRRDGRPCREATRLQKTGARPGPPRAGPLMRALGP